MADRVTQLQEAVNQLGEYYCSSIGVLQASPESQQQPNADNSMLFSTLITRTCQDVDILIDSLPNQEYTQDCQDSSLWKLEAENRLAAEKLKKTVEASELLLKKIRLALEEISNSELGISETTSKAS